MHMRHTPTYNYFDHMLKRNASQTLTYNNIKDKDCWIRHLILSWFHATSEGDNEGVVQKCNQHYQIPSQRPWCIREHVRLQKLVLLLRSSIFPESICLHPLSSLFLTRLIVFSDFLLNA